MDKAVEVDFLDMDLTAVDRVDDLLRDVETEHLAARARYDGGCGKSDVAQPYDTDVRLLVRFHARAAPRFGARSAHLRRDCGRAPWLRKLRYRRAKLIFRYRSSQPR